RKRLKVSARSRHSIGPFIRKPKARRDQRRSGEAVSTFHKVCESRGINRYSDAWFVLKAIVTVFDSLGATVIVSLLVPYSSCHAKSSYSPGGTFLISKDPSLPVTWKYGFESTATYAFIQGCTLHFT